MKSLKIFSVLLILLSVITGCKLSNPSVMLRTPKGFVYDKFPAVPDSQYIIAKDDIIGFRLMANDGIGLVEVMGAEMAGGNNTAGGQKQNQEFTVEFDGTIKLPVLGRFKITGLTERQAEDSLENRFSSLYKKPFVQLKVVNRRVTVFPGGMGTAKVIPLVNQNMTLFEALALSGGIDPDGKAYRIKLIRGSLKRPYVFLIDASTIETIQQADLVLQADDIIYVEPLERPIRVFTRDVAPWIGLITSTVGLAVTIYTLTRIYQ